jgi:SAM-dependent methyltransferase
VPHHPQLQRRQDPASKAGRDREVATLTRFLKRFLTPQAVFMEIGAGDCALSLRITREAAHVIAIDVSTEITKGMSVPPNFDLIISDGSSVPVPPAAVDLAFSNQLMEHLHTADALAQLHAINATLAPGGTYICVTPSRVSGPHDISRHFDDVATGLHLKEYTAAELVVLFRHAGFSRLRIRLAGMGGRGSDLVVHPLPVIALEKTLQALPARARKRLTANDYLAGLLGVWMIAKK